MLTTKSDFFQPSFSSVRRSSLNPHTICSTRPAPRTSLSERLLWDRHRVTKTFSVHTTLLHIYVASTRKEVLKTNHYITEAHGREPDRETNWPILVDEHQSLNALWAAQGLCCIHAGADHLCQSAEHWNHSLFREVTNWLTLPTARQVCHQVRYSMLSCTSTREKKGIISYTSPNKQSTKVKSCSLVKGWLSKVYLDFAKISAFSR